MTTDAFHVYDTTLRDGAQREGISYSVNDKLAVARARKWVEERESPMEARRVTRDRGKVYIERIYSGRLTTPGTAIVQRLWVFEDQWASAGESVEALASGVRTWEEGTWV